MYRFGRLLYGKKILWFGGSGFARTHVAPFFRSCVHQYCVLEGLPLERDKLHIVGTANSIEVVLNKLKNRKFHLIISKFGQYGGNILFMEMIKRLRKYVVMISTIMMKVVVLVVLVQVIGVM